MNYSLPKRIGILGGGQLGAMLAHSASQLGIACHIYCPDETPPAARFCERYVCGSYDDINKLKEFVSRIDCLTYEFENIPCDTLEKFKDDINIYPSINALRISQDRQKEKEFILSLKLKTAPFLIVPAEQKPQQINCNIPLPIIAKTCRFGYDGKGQYTINTQDEFENFLSSTRQEKMILEQRIPFTKEVSMIAARDVFGKVITYPATHNVHIDGILATSQAPADISHITQKKLVDAVTLIANTLDYVGVIAVEFFIVSDRKNDIIYINEFAPRVHNSGHWTQDCADISQFLQHIRCISLLPAIEAHCQKGGMINLIGHDIDHISQYLNLPHHYVHIYGKEAIRNGRKMGHVNWKKDR